LVQGVPERLPVPAFHPGVINPNLLLGESSAKLNSMFRSLFSAGMLALVLQANAQSYVHQVVVLNEGYFDYFDTQVQVVPVTIGSYDPATGAYSTVVTLTGPRFGSDVLVDGSDVFVAADDRVLRFSADGFTQLGEVLVSGVRKLAVWNDQLLLTCGEVGGLDHYFEARDRNSLELLYTIGPDQGLPYSAEDVVVLDDKAYLAVNNAFDWANVIGRVGVVDLLSGIYTGEVDLGPDGTNPEKIMVKDGALYVFNNKDFSGSSISKVEADGAVLAYTTNVATNSGCAASVMADGRIYYMEYEQAELARFDVSSGQVLDTLAGSPDVYGLIDDPINDVLYATTTDFFSSGDLHVLNLEGQILSTIAVGVAPGNLALDIRNSTNVAQVEPNTFSVYPNPANERITLRGALPEGSVLVIVQDALGRTVLTNTTTLGQQADLDISTLNTGVYTVRLNGGKAMRFTKQ
jgi:hypothetical protein